MSVKWNALAVPFKSSLDCSHGFFANCPVHSYNNPEEIMRGMAIVLQPKCSCTHYCANWPNCKGGDYRSERGSEHG